MKNTTTVSLTSAQLQQAADLQKTIEISQNELTALLMGQSVTKAKSTGKGHKAPKTEAQKAAISEGLKAKWAERKALKAANATTPATAQTPANAS